MAEPTAKEILEKVRKKENATIEDLAKEVEKYAPADIEEVRIRSGSNRKKRSSAPTPTPESTPETKPKTVIGVSDVELKQSRKPVRIEDFRILKEIQGQKLQSREPSKKKSISVEEARSKPNTKKVYFETDLATGDKKVLAVQKEFIPDLTPRIDVAKKKTTTEKVFGFAKELGSEFAAGFTFKESPTLSLTSQQQLELALTGKNPKTGREETKLEVGAKQLSNLFGTGSAIATEKISEGVGLVVSKTPVVDRVTTIIGNIATSKPVVGTLTFFAGKELVESANEGSTEFARTGVNIIKDVTFFGNVIKPLPVKPLEITSPLKITRVEIPTESGINTFRSLGLDVGTKSQPLITSTPEGIKFGTPKIENKIAISELSNSISQPEIALGGKVLKSALELTPAESSRIESVIGAGRILGTDKGLTPKDIIFKVEGLKNPETASVLIEKFTKEQSGIIFGSAVTQRLPEGFVSQKIGDVDIFVKSKPVAEIEPELQQLTKLLRTSGEDVIFNPEKLSIDFKNGGKLLEVKSGIDQSSLGLSDEAPVKFLGFDIANNVGVKFGTVESITAGQQFLRKGSASTIISPPTKGAEFPSFSQGGVVGKITIDNPRGTKDIAGFIQTGEGLVQIRQDSINPFTRVKGKQAAEELKVFRESFTPEQQLDINLKLKSLVGDNSPLLISSKPTGEPVSVITKLQSPFYPRSPENRFDFDLNKSSIALSETSISSPSLANDFISLNDISKKSKRDESPNIVSDSSFVPVSNFVSISDVSPSPKTNSPSNGSKSPLSDSPKSPISDSSIIDSSLFDSKGSKSPSPKSPISKSPYDLPSRFATSNQPSVFALPSASPFLGNVGKPLFDVLVGGVDRKFFFQQQDLTLDQAIQFGKGKVKETAAASFRIVPKDGLNNNYINEIQSALGNEFTRSKKEDDLFVQKRQFRIGSIGEKEDITLLGLEANRRKDLKSLF